MLAKRAQQQAMGTTQLQLLQGTFLLGAAAPLAEQLVVKAVLHRAATITSMAVKAGLPQAVVGVAEVEQPDPMEMVGMGHLLVLGGLLTQAPPDNTLELGGALAEAPEEAKRLPWEVDSQLPAAEELALLRALRLQSLQQQQGSESKRRSQQGRGG
jgi:hypothetical protein